MFSFHFKEREIGEKINLNYKFEKEVYKISKVSKLF